MPLDFGERLRYLELKTNAWMNWGNHYDLDRLEDKTACARQTTLIEYDPACTVGLGNLSSPEAIEDQAGEMVKRCPGLYDHYICLDNFPAKPPPPPSSSSSPDIDPASSSSPPCVVYDFGIREQPQFGMRMALNFSCEVHAFDPSPISTEYASKHLKDIPNYSFHPFGAGGVDDTVTLYKYNWEQVSQIRLPMYTDKWRCLNPDIKDCGAKVPEGGNNNPEEMFSLPVRTLPSIMAELGHSHIDILKIDVEGSEYSLLEQLFDTYGCPPIEQITLEWHHFWFDPRYGAGSSPPNNAIITLLHRCGYRQFRHHLPGGWPTDGEIFLKHGFDDVRYNIASFIKVNK